MKLFFRFFLWCVGLLCCAETLSAAPVAVPPAKSLPVTAKTATPVVAATVAGANELPLRSFAYPQLEQRNSMRPIVKGSLDIRQKLSVAGQQAIPYRPFVLGDVFNLQTGEPLFIGLIDLNSGGLKLPHDPKMKLSYSKQSNIVELQRKGISADVSTVKAYRLEGRQPYNDKSILMIPRKSGSSIRIPVAYFLRELNSYERSMNAIGITLRDPQTGKISASPRSITVAKLKQDTAAIQRLQVESEQKQIRNIPVKQISETEITGMQQQFVTKAPTILQQYKKRPRIPGKSRLNLQPKGLAVTTAMVPATSRIPVSSQVCMLAKPPEGGLPGESITVDVARFDPAVCMVQLEDVKGGQADVAAVPVSANKLKLTLPANMAFGTGYITLKERNSPLAMSTAPLFIGSPCSVESSSADAGVAGMELTLSVGRFEKCDLAFVDRNTIKHTVPFVVRDQGVLTAKIPNITVGTSRIIGIPWVNAAQPTVSGVTVNIMPAMPATAQGTSVPAEFFNVGVQPFERKYGDNQKFGDPGTLAAELVADVSVSSKGEIDDNLVRFKANGGVKGYLFGNQAEIIGAHADLSMPTGTSQDTNLRANFRISTVGGIDVYTWQRRNDLLNGLVDESSPFCKGEFFPGAVCEPPKQDGAVLPFQFNLQKDFRLINLDYGVETNFAIGPVPMVARIGFRGGVGTKVLLAASPVGITGKVTPYANTEVYGECGVDVEFASAGVGANLTMVNASLDAYATANIDFSQQPVSFVTDMNVAANYEILSGSLYLFADVFNWRYVVDLFNYPGFKNTVYLLPPQKKSYPLFAPGGSGVLATLTGTAGATCNPSTMSFKPLNGAERCFGAIGSGCLNQATAVAFGTSVIPGTPVAIPANDCTISVMASVGSILHDNCCNDHTDGLYCSGGGMNPTSFAKDDIPAQFRDTVCAREWRKAVNDVLEKRYWPETFGPYLSNNNGDNIDLVPPRKAITFGPGGYGDNPVVVGLNSDRETGKGFRLANERVATRRLQAPSNTRLEFGDHNFCRSGEFKSEGWCTLTECSDSTNFQNASKLYNSSRATCSKPVDEKTKNNCALIDSRY